MQVVVGVLMLLLLLVLLEGVMRWGAGGRLSQWG